MPCPFFEPLAVVPHAQHRGARLPLIEEHDGLCHAQPTPIAAPAELRFRCCNHGYSRGSCRHLPAEAANSATRFDVLAADSEGLQILYVEERDYAPVRWQQLRYSIRAATLEPELEEDCVRAQARAFCTSFLRRFGAAEPVYFPAPAAEAI